MSQEPLKTETAEKPVVEKVEKVCDEKEEKVSGKGTCVELKELCKQLGLRGYSTANKAKLISLLEEQSARAAEIEKELVANTEKASPISKKPVNHRKSSKWNQFLSEYSKENGCTLKTAMSKKEEYKAWKEIKTA
jgi:hypothetical protein